MNNRVIIYLILFITTLMLLALPQVLTSPGRNLKIVKKIASNNPQRSTHQSFSSFYKKLPNGFVVVFYAGNDSNYAPTEFVTISELSGQLEVDLINGAGEANVVSLRGQDAINFIQQHDIDLEDFR